MSIDELNNYLFEARKNRYKGKGRKWKSTIENCPVPSYTYITEEPYKSEVIRYLAKNRGNFIEKLYKLDYIDIEYIIMISKNCPEIFYCLSYDFYKKYPRLLSELISNNLAIYDLLPKKIRDLDEVKSAFNQDRKIYNNDLRDREGYDINWLDENGNLKKYFKLKNNFPITSKDDYLKIVEIYLVSDLSIPQFCKVYSISSIDGFNKLLRRVGYESIDAQQKITKVKSEAKERYLSNIKSIAKQIDDDNITFEQYLKNSYSPYHRFKLLFTNVNDKEKLMKQVLDYFVCNKDLLQLDNLINLFETDMSHLVKEINSYASIAGFNSSYTSKLLYPIIKKYEIKYSRNNMRTTIIKNDERYDIDDDVIDSALLYLKDNNIYICHKTVLDISKKIVFKELDYSKETRAKKEELKEEIIRIALQKVKDIESYMQAMEEVSKKI